MVPRCGVAGGDADAGSPLPWSGRPRPDERQNRGPRAAAGKELRVRQPARPGDPRCVIDTAGREDASIRLLEEDDIGPQRRNLGQAPGELIPGPALLQIE